MTPVMRCLVLALALAAAVGCSSSQSSSPTSSGSATAEGPTGPTPGYPWFLETTKEAGIDFHHFDSVTELLAIQEATGSGMGWIDYNADGWPDLFFVQDGPVFPERHKGPLPTHKLYRNNGDGTFTDVTAQVGLDKTGYGMGCAVGDYDNDGFDDLVVTYFDRIDLFHNEPDGQGGRKFADVTGRSGLVNPHWGTSCAWGDLDGDGLLDLYVCNYVEVDMAHYQPCIDPRSNKRQACPPRGFPHTSHRLFRNKGNGVFEDVSVSSGITGVEPAPGLAVAIADLDGDGKQDVWVANDMKPAYLWHNQGGFKFAEKGIFSGSALAPGGRYMAAMGIAIADFEGTGRPSLLITNYHREPNVLFLNRGKLNFVEWSHASGIGPASTRLLKFGIVMIDADLDGPLDVVTANGHISPNSQELWGEPYEQELQFFQGLGKGRFRDASGQVGPYFKVRRVGRGLGWADYDNDGRPDLAVSNNGGPAALLHNATPTENTWIRLELVGDGKQSNRNAVGSKVEVEAGGVKQTHFLYGGGSFLSASDRRLVIGLGSAAKAEAVKVTWPSGRQQTFRDLGGKQWWRFREGDERAEAVTPGPARP